MFTLKVMLKPRAASGDRAVWFAGTTVVSLVREGSVAEMRALIHPDAHGNVLYAAQDYVSSSAGDSDPAGLIYAVANGEEIYLLVEQAWLLGPDGQSVDRVFSSGR
jgi:hypothetical protein